MIDKQFDKETFKKSVKDNVKFLYRRKLVHGVSYGTCPWKQPFKPWCIR